MTHAAVDHTIQERRKEKGEKEDEKRERRKEKEKKKRRLSTMAAYFPKEAIKTKES